MTAIVWALLGLIVGAFLIGVGVALYFLVSVMKALTVELKSIRITLSPILSSEDLPRALKAFMALATQGEMLSRRMDGLIATIQQFYKHTFAPKTDVPAGSEQSAVFYSDEEELSSRETAHKLRKQGIETEEGRVSQAVSEAAPLENDTPIY